jgi:hypothetical protein
MSKCKSCGSEENSLTICNKQELLDARELCQNRAANVKTLLDGKEENLKTLIYGNNKRYEERFKSSEQAVKDAFASSQTAIIKSESSQEKRNDAVYVTIAEMTKFQSTLMARTEYDTNHKAIVEKISDLQLGMKDFLSLSTFSASHGDLQKQIDAINKKVDTILDLSRGKSMGMGMIWAWVIGGATLVGVVIAVILNSLRLFTGK